MHGSCFGVELMSNHVTTVLLWLPYVAGVLLWAKCMSFARSHSVDLQAVTKRGSVHWLAFPVVCLEPIPKPLTGINELVGWRCAETNG